MGEVLKNAASEVALRQREPAFVPAKSTAEKIQQLQTSESWAERRVIVDALGTDSSEAATEALTHVLKEEISELQEFAGRALGRQATPASLEVLRAMATMKEPSLMASKLAATRGLGVSKKQESLEILLPMLQSEKEPSMRWAALDAIAEIGHASAGPALMEYLQSLEGTSANTSRNKTVRALGLTGDPSAIPILQAALKNPEFANSRRAVIEALTRLGAPPKS
jgi:HEAT repeat protein